MKRDNEIYSVNKGYSPFVYKSATGLNFCFPVTSGHVDMEFDFEISEQDLAVMKTSLFRFKALYYILFHEAQSTFGTGNSNPRIFKYEEFEVIKNNVLYKTENELTQRIKDFSKQKNLAENYFESFSRNVFQ